MEDVVPVEEAVEDAGAVGANNRDRADVKAEKRQLGDDQRTSDSAGRNHEKNNGGSPGIARHSRHNKLQK